MFRTPGVFEYRAPQWCSPQFWSSSSVHTLGTVMLSRKRPQGRSLRHHLPRSAGCGFVANSCPQTVDGNLSTGPGDELSTGGPQAGRCCPQLLHTLVHCSATKRPGSPCRVKAVTPRCRVALWGSRVKLGTDLGRSTPPLCIGCAQLFAVHRSGQLSTGSTHRRGGQKSGPELRKQGYPRFPQALLLLPPIVTGEMASKWVLCTT